MALLSAIMLLFCLLGGSVQALVRCNENVTKLQVCSLISDYDKSSSGENPLKLGTSVTVFKIAELDEKQHTISLNLLLSVWWYDTRLTIESNNSNKYVFLLECPIEQLRYNCHGSSQISDFSVYDVKTNL